MRLRKGPFIQQFDSCTEIEVVLRDGGLAFDDILVVFFSGYPENSVEGETARNVFEQTAMLLEEIDTKFLFGVSADRDCAFNIYQYQLKDKDASGLLSSNDPIVAMYNKTGGSS